MNKTQYTYDDEYGITGEPEPDEWDFDYYITCPRCKENAFQSDGQVQETDGQWSFCWSCDACGYWETL